MENSVKGYCFVTDKASNPINLYGATKLASDKFSLHQTILFRKS